MRSTLRTTRPAVVSLTPQSDPSRNQVLQQHQHLVVAAQHGGSAFANLLLLPRLYAAHHGFEGAGFDPGQSSNLSFLTLSQLPRFPFITPLQYFFHFCRRSNDYPFDSGVTDGLASKR